MARSDVDRVLGRGAVLALTALVVTLGVAGGCGGSSPVAPTPVATSPPPSPDPPPPPPPPVPPPRPPAPVLSVTRFVAFGDSLTAGFIAVSSTSTVPSLPHAYPTKLEALLKDRYYDQPNIFVANEGRNGEWAQDGPWRIVTVMNAWQPDVLLLMQGANDLSALGMRGVSDALEGLEDSLRDARARGAIVFLATLPPQVPDSRLGVSAGRVLDETNEGIRRLAARQNVTLVDVHAAFRGDFGLLSPDGLHPNEAGYQRIAEAFFDAIRSRFERPDPS